MPTLSSKTKTQKKIHIHPEHELNNDFLLCCFALLGMGFFFYGPRVLLLALIGWLTALLTDRFCVFLRDKKYDQTENSSSVIALLITLLMPASVPVHILVFAVIAGVLLGKQVFGGSSYPFNPVAVGYAVAIVSWPNEIFKFPQPINWVTVVSSDPTISSLLATFSLQNSMFTQSASAAMHSGVLPKYSLLEMFLGNAPTPLGAGSIVVLLGCLVFLLLKKRVSFAVIGSFVASLFVISFFLPRAPWGIGELMPWVNWQARLVSTLYEFLCNTTIFAVVFLISEAKTLPKTRRSRILYGVALAVSTAIFRFFGVYQIGVCFAVLFVNSISGFFDRIFALPSITSEKEALKK